MQTSFYEIGMFDNEGLEVSARNYLENLHPCLFRKEIGAHRSVHLLIPWKWAMLRKRTCMLFKYKNIIQMKYVIVNKTSTNNHENSLIFLN